MVILLWHATALVGHPYHTIQYWRHLLCPGVEADDMQQKLQCWSLLSIPRSQEENQGTKNPPKRELSLCTNSMYTKLYMG